jgi:hypothetical protein
MEAYPWYKIVESPEQLEQGDIIFNCPIVQLKFIDENLKAFKGIANVIILSQSCDLENKKVENVLVCRVYEKKEFSKLKTDFTKSRQEQLRKGLFVKYRELEKCNLDPFLLDNLIVDFQETHSLPIDFIIQIVQSTPKRIRLLPPYREHLAQAFAFFYMRIALPADLR